MIKFQINTSSLAIALLLAIGLLFGAGHQSYAQKDTTQANLRNPQGIANPDQGDKPGGTSNSPSPGGAGGDLSADAAVVSAGAALFEANCKQCHAVHAQVVGPQLSGVYERQSVAWLINFIKYPEKVIKSGDAHAVDLYNKYKQFMPNHDFLDDNQIKSILSYIKAETIKGPTADTPKGPGKEGQAADNATGPNSSMLTAIIAGLGVLLILVLGVLVLLATVLTRYLQKEQNLTDADKEILGQRFSLRDLLQSRAFIGIVAFLFVAIISKAAVEGMINIGVQRGYAPSQPIAFSHKLHAGEYAIDCRYCHTGVEKGKSANIPSANICMNCHNAIKTGSPEIQKIYNAVLQDKPIQWIRVHNLPDLAYFNHAQHTQVGGLQCQTCHGPIQNMEVVYQYSALTMGWCINCHRETPLNTKDNGYYDNLVKLHNTANNGAPFTVSSNGGTECSKCHY